VSGRIASDQRSEGEKMLKLTHPNFDEPVFVDASQVFSIVGEPDRCMIISRNDATVFVRELAIDVERMVCEAKGLITPEEAARRIREAPLEPFSPMLSSGRDWAFLNKKSPLEQS
jgi:hypothetical protein